MSSRPWLRILVTLPLAALLLAVGAAPAQAGVLQVQDDAHALSADDVARLDRALADAPFDARLAVTGAYSDADGLSRYVGSLLTSPNMVAVGIDPDHHRVQVHFGTGSGVPRADWPAIERAGNGAFRRGAWEEGAAAIFGAASHASAAAGPPGNAYGAPLAPRPRSMFGILPRLMLVALGIGVLALLLRRRSAYGNAGYGGYGYGPYPGDYPGQPPRGGLGPLGGGMIGAGLGGLAGYELGKMEGEREQRELDRSGPDRELNDPSQGFDAGGGGSSWDAGGGGGDFGGGDGGGGGSDF